MLENLERMDGTAWDKMQNATLGLNQNYHGLLKLQDGTPIGILMYHDGLFRVLEEMTQIGFDGTFFVTPEPFYQLYTVHFIVQSHSFKDVSLSSSC